MLDLSVDEVLTTTRAVRRRLDLERPVPRAVVEECLQLAFQAPNGSNTQPWHWILVEDAATKTAMAEIYRGGMDDHIARSAAARGASSSAPPSPGAPAPGVERMSASVFHLREHLADVPVLVVAGVNGRLNDASIFEQASLWGSVLPAIWSFMLALRSRALGSAWTTIHLHRERAMAELLGIPFEGVTQAGLFPVAYTVGTDFRPGARVLSPDTIHWDRW